VSFLTDFGAVIDWGPSCFEWPADNRQPAATKPASQTASNMSDLRVTQTSKSCCNCPLVSGVLWHACGEFYLGHAANQLLQCDGRQASIRVSSFLYLKHALFNIIQVRVYVIGSNNAVKLLLPGDLGDLLSEHLIKDDNDVDDDDDDDDGNRQLKVNPPAANSVVTIALHEKKKGFVKIQFRLASSMRASSRRRA
jgi:hypothetical protein